MEIFGIAIVGVYNYYFRNANVPTTIWKDCFVPANNRYLHGWHNNINGWRHVDYRYSTKSAFHFSVLAGQKELGSSQCEWNGEDQLSSSITDRLRERLRVQNNIFFSSGHNWPNFCALADYIFTSTSRWPTVKAHFIFVKSYRRAI